MIDFNRHIEIENYIQGKLTPEKRSVFEAKMASDKHLREEVELQKLANSVIATGAKLDIKNQLQNIHSDYKKGKANNRNFKLLTVIGAILLGITYMISLFGEEEPKKEDNPVIEKTINVPNDNTQKENKENYQNESDHALQQINDSKATDSPISKGKPTNKTPGAIRDSVTSVDWGSFTGGRDSTDTSIINSYRPGGLTDSPRNDNDTVKTSGTDNEGAFNLCKEIEDLKPKYSMTQPCFGKTKGTISFNDSRFEYFQTNLNNEPYTNFDEVEVPTGSIFITGIDDKNCKTKPLKVDVKYDDCTYSIQPSNMQFLEFSFNEDEVPVIFTLRSARSGFEVYKQIIEFAGDFTYEGIATDGSQLPMGNYVYLVTKPSGEFITKGQITIVR